MVILRDEEERNMRSKIGFMVLLIGAMALLAACGGEKYAPQAINEETDVCEVCKMAIKDDQFATQIVTKDGRSLKFDDLGDMNVWMTENGTADIGAAYVRDYHSRAWIRYEDAYYVYDPSFRTPMAYGVVSFETEADAQAFIEEQGTGILMTADDLAHHSWEVNHEMMEGHGHSHGDDGHGHSHGEDVRAQDGHGEHAHGEDGHGADAHAENDHGGHASDQAEEHDEHAASGGHGS
jgi:copper chaperone NosL